jgi:hypothetical protein
MAVRDCIAITNDASAQCPPLAGAGGGLVKLAIMLIICRWGVLYPPPSLRDTSASGGYEITFFAIAIQSPGGGRGRFIRKSMSISGHYLRTLFLS